MEALMESIRYHSRTFPRNELKQIMEKKDEAIPLLLQVMEEVRTNPEVFLEEPSRMDHIYAAHLLAQFRVKAFFPIFVDILHLPGDTPSDLFGDTLTEGANRILASTYDGNIDLLKNLIENNELNQFVHNAALNSLVILALYDEMEREEVIAYFKELLNGNNLQSPSLVTNVIGACDSLYPEEVYDDIKHLYDQDMVEEFVINLRDIDWTLSQPKEFVLKRTREDRHFQYMGDTIQEMYWWAAFDQPKSKSGKIKPWKRNKLKSQKPSLSHTVNPAVKVKKVGRNEPCPCGSGRKYKKCCGA